MVKNELQVDVNAELAALTSSSATAPGPAHENIVDLPADDGFQAPDSPFWSDPSKEFGSFLTGSDDKAKGAPKADAEAPKTAAARAEANAKAAAITYKANGKERTLDLSKPEVIEEVKRKLAVAEGKEKAFDRAAQAEQRLKQMEADLKEAREKAQYLDKLESLRYDKAKLVEIVTGQKYDEFIQDEVAKANIKLHGTEEEKRLLEQQDRIRALEERLKLGEETTAKQAADAARKQKAAEAAEAAAKQEWLKTNVEREYYRAVEGIEDESIKELIHQKSILDIKKMYKEYGKVTNKMVEKAFADNAKRLKAFHDTTVTNEVTKALDSKRQVATQAAQAASTKNYDGNIQETDLAKLSPDKLFQALKFLNSRK